MVTALPSLIGPERLAVLRMIAAGTPPGTVIEVGVYKGGSAKVLSSLCAEQGRPLFLYDTFAGIPHACECDSHRIGDFADGMTFRDALAAFPDARVQQGIFPHSVELPDTIAFAHLDCDQYQSYREALPVLADRMIPRGVIVCDDWALEGARRAIVEFPHPHELLPDGRAVLKF